MISRDDEPLRVLMISPQFRPLVGGYERAAERLSVALAEAGMRVVVIAERRDRAWPAVECIDGYEVRRLSCSYRRHLHAITSLLSFASFLLRHGREFDVWHVHQYGYHAALAVALGKLSASAGGAQIDEFRCHGHRKSDGQRHCWAHPAAFFIGGSAPASRSARRPARRRSVSAFPPSASTSSPMAWMAAQFHPASPEERIAARRVLGLDCERFVLYVGRLSAEKNPLGLLDAWAAVDTKAREGALLALVGDGPERDQVHARAQTPNLAGSVHLAGYRSDVATWYRAADVYVISSHLEGLSNSMIEALASGLPVISTRVSGSSILVESPAAGLVVDVGDVEKLAGAMESLLRDESMRMRLGENARLAVRIALFVGNPLEEN